MEGPVATVVQFGHELTDLDERFSLAASTLDFSTQSVCYFSLSAGAANYTNVRFYLDVTEGGATRQILAAERLSSRQNAIDIVTADTLEDLAPNAAVTPRRESILTGDLTSLTAFCPSDVMTSPTLHFKRTSRSNRLSQGYLVWDEDNRNSVTTSTRDAYFFTFTAQVNTGRSFVDIELKLCDKIFTIRRRHFIYDGLDTFTTSAIVECDLQKKDAFVKLTQPIALQTASLFGFPYRPAHNLRAYWTIVRSRPSIRASEPFFSFDERAVARSLVTGIYDNSGVVLQHPGYYYIHLSAVVDARQATDFQVVQYDQTTFVETTLFSVTRLSTIHDGPDFISRSAIVRLGKDQMVRVRNPLVRSTSAIGTRLSGMLLYAL